MILLTLNLAKRLTYRYSNFIVCIISGIILIGCTETENAKSSNIGISNEYPIHFEGEALSLCWDPPLNNSDSVSSYEVYYHSGKSSSWIILKQNIAAGVIPSVIINRTEIDSTDSIFYFAVRSVMKDGTKSDYHQSMDSTAIPPYWCLKWNNVSQ